MDLTDRSRNDAFSHGKKKKIIYEGSLPKARTHAVISTIFYSKKGVKMKKGAKFASINYNKNYDSWSNQKWKALKFYYLPKREHIKKNQKGEENERRLERGGGWLVKMEIEISG